MTLVLRGRALVARGGGTPGGRRGGGGGEDGTRAVVNLFLLPRAERPVAIALPPPPPVSVAQLPAPSALPLALPPVELAPSRLSVTPLRSAGLQNFAAQGSTANAGSGEGVGGGPGRGTGVGTDTGPGTAGGAGYIFQPAPRTAILPPLARVPGSVAGHTYRVRFWVATDGRVTRVVVEPPITDADYSREFEQRMMAYQFYPAHTRDGRTVAGVFTLSLRPGH